jgi:isocitrate lyase
MLAYNLSPSFNWDASGMSDQQLARFNDDLGKMGYVWQFITLAGFHSNGLVVTKLARSYGDRGMLAYVQDIQREEKEHQVELLTHQKVSGSRRFSIPCHVLSFSNMLVMICSGPEQNS